MKIRIFWCAINRRALPCRVPALEWQIWKAALRIIWHLRHRARCRVSGSLHRLDQPVSGILVFAKTPAAAKDLNRQLTTSGFGKHYYALVAGTPEPTSADLENFLVKDARTNTSRICQKGTADAKLAKLHYDLVDTTFFADIASAIPVATSQLKIKLDTGRHHQIRVQLSGMGCPIIGDTKYNPDSPKLTARRTPLCLCAYQLEFRHPVTKKAMTFSLDHYV